MRKLLSAMAVMVVFAMATVAFGCGKSEEHTLKYIAAQDATCVADGHKAYYVCSDCGKFFADADGREEVSESSLKLAATGHEYEAGVYSFDDDEHWQVCKKCSAATEHVAHEPGAWQKEGDNHWRVCSVCNNDVSFGAHAYIYDSDADEHWQACGVCGDSTVHVGHNIVDVEEEAATFVAPGHTAGRACDACGYAESGCDEIPATSLFTAEKYEGLNYCLYEPEIAEGTKLPLVLFLHGAGERGNDNCSQLTNGILNVVYDGSTSMFMNSVVIAPQCPTGARWVNFDWTRGNYSINCIAETQLMKDVIALVEHYRSLPYIDTDKVYIIGISMGGYGVWDALARHGDLFAAGVAICGGGPIDADVTLKDEPIYVFHNTGDTTVPCKASEDIYASIHDLQGGEKIILKTFEDNSHNAWDAAITFTGDGDHPALETWLFAQTDATAPAGPAA